MIRIAQPLIGEEEKQAVLEVLDSGMLAQGPRVQAFEEAFAELCGVKHAIATSSGTTALHTALIAHDLGPGDEVLTTSFTFIATANSILFTGARPVFVDIEPRTFNLNPGLIESTLTSHTRAIMPVHLYGLSCDMDPILEIASRHHLAIIEDACQSHGARYYGRRVGSFGTGTYSLYPTKNMTSAEGGMITTDDDRLAESCQTLRQHGTRGGESQVALGFNFRMSDVHAAIGLEQLKKLDHFNQVRQENAHFLSEHLKGVTVPYVPAGYEHVFHQYTVRVPHGLRDELAATMLERGIATGIYYPKPVHQQTYYQKELGYQLSLPETEKASREVLSLPVHPALSQSDLEKIVATVNQFMHQRGVL